MASLGFLGHAGIRREAVGNFAVHCMPEDFRNTLDARIDEMLATVRRDRERYGDAVRL